MDIQNLFKNLKFEARIDVLAELSGAVVEEMYKEFIGYGKKDEVEKHGKGQFSNLIMPDGGWRTPEIQNPIFSRIDLYIDQWGGPPYSNSNKEYMLFQKRIAIAVSFQTDSRITFHAVGQAVTSLVCNWKLLKIYFSTKNCSPADKG